MQIRPLTMSIVVGSAACNARCPFCVSKMTPANGVSLKAEDINFKNWHQACRLAKDSGVTTILLTGKGEPTLFPFQIENVLEKLRPYDFPIIEMQTNAIPIADGKISEAQLERWFEMGLRTIAISNVGINEKLNREIYLPYKGEYIALKAVIGRLHRIGFSVRLATVMIKGGIDSPEAVEELLKFCQEQKVEQLTIRPVTKPGETGDEEGRVALGWVENNFVTEGQIYKIREWVMNNGTRLMTLPHGAEVYDVHGQNICLTNCLTTNDKPDEIRQLIYFPDGHIRYSWEFSGAIIM